MYGQFISYSRKNNLFVSDDRILLAVSGGVDSVVMAGLFHRAGFDFGIAHCNFQLRGKDSDGDERFVKQLSNKYDCPFFAKKFNTRKYAKENGLSLQMAARELRYRWFEQVRKNENYSFIATAHHRDDSVETILLNFFRGTGIEGLTGIQPKNGYIIRPILFARRQDIEKYAVKEKVQFRKDRSNDELVYKRNFIRKKIIPALYKINPSLENTLLRNAGIFYRTGEILSNHFQKELEKIIDLKNRITSISIGGLMKLQPHAADFLFEFLRNYGFNYETVQDISCSLTGQSGKRFFSGTHRIIIDRKYLILEKISMVRITHDQYSIEKEQKRLPVNGMTLLFQFKRGNELSLEKIKSICRTRGNNIAFLDAAKLSFPLILRRWKKGDFFYPLGMKGKKKLSDFFIDRKVPLNEKEKIFVLCSGEDIVWIAGYATDERYKVTKKIKEVYVAEMEGF
ncbi:MAG: tRNA lysidine(34) synthetase TilS [Bacteroidetes bacterium]|nr:tRNA lysidine(34) synthetase TilS [Bacteroidota bacterium]